MIILGRVRLTIAFLVPLINNNQITAPSFILTSLSLLHFHLMNLTLLKN